MGITGILVMPADAALIPVAQLSDELRRQVMAAEGDYAVTRPNSRVLARIVDSDGARLVQEFRQPSTVAQAVLRYCRATNEDPESTLDAAFPMLERLVHAGLLVAAVSPLAQRIRPMLEIGSRFAGIEVVACLQALEDTDLYHVKTMNGDSAALKLMRSVSDSESGFKFDHEASVLNHLDGAITPTLLATGAENNLRYMLLSWCDGSDCATFAAQLRPSNDFVGLLRLSLAILDAYAHLHAQNVIHSDIHPRNILVDDSFSVRLIDFGLARIAGCENEIHPQRGGVGYFFEPEYATSVRRGQRAPHSSMPGEQYGLAALLHLLITGEQYLDFSLESREFLRQICEDGPRPFDSYGIRRWPAMEEILARALAKDPACRFPSVNDFATALRSVEEPPARAIASDQGTVSYDTATRTLTRILNRLKADGPLLQSGLASAPRASVTYGSAGVACALHRIACARHDPTLLSLADLWGERAARDGRRDDAWYCPEIKITSDAVGRVSPYHTESGVHFIKALIAHSMGDVITEQIAADSFVAAVSQTPCENPDLTLGRSGILLATSHLVAALRGNSFVNIVALRDLGNATVASIWQQLDSYASIVECHEIGYSGMAHGWAGILYATLCWCRASGTALPSNTEERLNQLAALACHSGRQAKWSWSTASQAHDTSRAYLPGWCNGSAGQVYLWLNAHSVFKDGRYFGLAEKAAWHVAKTDSGNGTLCCGFSGQAYALLALHRSSGERAWLHWAQRLAERAAIACRDLPPRQDFDAPALRPDSLYQGELGVAVLAAELDHPSESALPAFEFIEY